MATALPAKRTGARGRPRRAKAQHAGLDAALALLAKGGYTAATIDEISARSGVAKTTIYRRWPNRAALVVDVLLRLAAVTAPPPAKGEPLRALRTEMSQVAAAAGQLPGQILASLIGEAQRDPEVRDALVQGLFKPRRNASASTIREAQLSGALRDGISPGVAVDLLFGPIFYRRLLRHEPTSEDYVRQVYEAAMQGLRSDKSRGRTRK